MSTTYFNMNYRKSQIKLIAITALAFLSSCSSPTELDTIVCTTTIVADVVEHLKPPGVAIMGPGVDPHLYKSKSKDHRMLNEAKVIVYSGLHLEGKMTDALENLSKKKAVINLSQGIKKDHLLKSADFAGSYDPHFWFDVKLYQEAVVHCSAELQKHFPEQKVVIAANCDAYILHLDSLFENLQTTLNNLPAEKRILITAHDAFSYYGKSHNMTVKGIQGASTAAEAGLQDITNLVDFIIDKKVAAIFVESSVSERNIEAIIEGCNKKGHDLHLGGSLFSDALGSKDSGGETYGKMMTHNTQTIVNALNKSDEN